MDDLLGNRLLVVPALAWASAQLLKFMEGLIRERRVNLAYLVTPGGMPSGHSALVSALAVGVARHHGIESPIFAVAAFFAAVVMYDAASVRRSVGIQAGILNRMLDERNGTTLAEERLRELIGHSPVQVAAGAVLGLGFSLMWG